MLNAMTPYIEGTHFALEAFLDHQLKAACNKDGEDQIRKLSSKQIPLSLFPNLLLQTPFIQISVLAFSYCFILW